MFEHKVVAGETVIQQGDDGDYFYVIEDGVYHALKNSEKVFEYNGDGNFGELALMYNMPRAATIEVSTPQHPHIGPPHPSSCQAQTDGSLWAMDRQTFRKIVLHSAFKKRKMYESFLENVSLLKLLEVGCDHTLGHTCIKCLCDVFPVDKDTHTKLPPRNTNGRI
jgi:cAMP-dependent protein kinase regulator